MLERISRETWAFDLEWVPDAAAGRILYGASNTSERDLLSLMWERGGATVQEPRPFLKTVMCRVVSIAVVRRSVTADGVQLSLSSLPVDVDDRQEVDERTMLRTFYQSVALHRPTLVGYNSAAADLRILRERAVIHGLSAPTLFAEGDSSGGGRSEGATESLDLMRALSGPGRSAPSLHELASLCGIPGKMGVDGADVAGLWLEGSHRRIVSYNECDALTTYLLWLRAAYAAGGFSAQEYQTECDRTRDLIRHRGRRRDTAHMRAYLAEWDRLSHLTLQAAPSCTESRACAEAVLADNAALLR